MPHKKSLFVCQWCNKEFEEWTYRQPRFCSRQCVCKYAARRPKPNTRKPEIHITLKCKTCGQPYKTTTHQVENRGSNFCSMSCYAQGRSKRMTGENNPNWTGGFNPSDYGPNWGGQSRKARKRDNYTCQICGYQSRTYNLDVHHIKSLRTFNGNYEIANHPDNLICLCRKCHRHVETGKISCPSPREL